MQFISSRQEEAKLNRSHGYDYPQDYDYWIWYILGGFLLFVAAILYLDTIPFYAKAKSVQGTVIELVPDASLEGYAPKGTFWDENRERRFEVIFSLSYSLKGYNEDERVTVFYDPEKPENARIGDFIDFFVVPTFFFLIGVVSCLWGFILIRTR